MVKFPPCSRARAAVLMSSLLFVTACSAVQDFGNVDTAVGLFHQRFSTGQDDAIYSELSPDFQKTIDRDTFHKWFSRIRRKLGAPLNMTRTGYSFRYNASGGIINVAYSTTFTKGSGAEMFVWRKSGNGFVLVGYNVQSILLLTD